MIRDSIKSMEEDVRPAQSTVQLKRCGSIPREVQYSMDTVTRVERDHEQQRFLCHKQPPSTAMQLGSVASVCGIAVVCLAQPSRIGRS